MMNALQANGLNTISARNSSMFWVLSIVFLTSICLPLPGPDGRIDGLPSLCPFHDLTGLPCPGCGLTRAFICLGHGRLMASLHWHPLGWLVFATLLALWARAGLALVLGRPVLPLSHDQVTRLSASGAALLLVAGIVRIGWFIAHPWLRLP